MSICDGLFTEEDGENRSGDRREGTRRFGGVRQTKTRLRRDGPFVDIRCSFLAREHSCKNEGQDIRDGDHSRSVSGSVRDVNSAHRALLVITTSLLAVENVANR